MKTRRKWPRSINVAQIGAYVGVGAIVNGSGYALFLVLLWVGVEHKLSAAITYALGVFASFLLNRRLVFESSVSFLSGVIRLCVMLLTGFFLNMALLYICVDRLNCPASVVQLFSIAFVSVCFYFLNKYFVHRSASL
ncbi:GtrA family protein [Pseudomonas moraviensis]|uniref:Putative flippase GtrA n=1 Tax=Pseudomonas moraviensis TaxID=321662 RepID=A0A7Y9VY73_9PSED|nr:GtrA family protein [Pseudomonas moraviensis]NYH10306.1 putative flippase GtrA [Pseudomonas moraviensis]